MSTATRSHPDPSALSLFFFLIFFFYFPFNGNSSRPFHRLARSPFSLLIWLRQASKTHKVFWQELSHLSIPKTSAHFPQISLSLVFSRVLSLAAHFWRRQATPSVRRRVRVYVPSTARLLPRCNNGPHTEAPRDDGTDRLGCLVLGPRTPSRHGFSLLPPQPSFSLFLLFPSVSIHLSLLLLLLPISFPPPPLGVRVFMREIECLSINM